MATLPVIVDFDNVEPALRAAGPVALARSILSLVPTAVFDQYDSANVRLYGGWRSGGGLTVGAQRLIPDIRASSPASYSYVISEVRQTVRLIVELADKPLGYSAILEETFVKERSLRKFRARRKPWNDCKEPPCGLHRFIDLTNNSDCPTSNCAVRLGDVLVRDEQKMVDTLMVADIARSALVDKSRDIVIVSSDTDMWPGLMLALNAGCYVTHIHTRPKWSTQRHLLRTIEGPLARFYHSTSP